MKPIESLAFWAADGGPLTLADAADRVHLAVFEGPAPAPRRAVVALRVDGEGFLGWRAHLTEELGEAPKLEDHTLAWSIYFRDPDGNPYEITTYEVEKIGASLSRPSRGAATPAPVRP